MILIEVDEAAAFDMLSILQIKLGITPNAFEAFKKLHASIKDQVGAEIMSKVMNSDEYVELANANVDIFNVLDPANIGDFSAYQVHSLNMERFDKKRALQKAFFEEDLKEEKTGG